jgi:hypothetical protein
VADSSRHSGDPLEKARAALSKLREADDWDEPTPLQLHVYPPPASRRSTPPPPPTRLQVVLNFFAPVVHRVPAWGLVLLGLACLAAWVFLAINGKAPVP